MAPARIAWIGLGSMGAPMCAHVIAGGQAVTVYDSDRSKMAAVCELGARSAASLQDAVAQATIVFTMLGSPAAAEAVYAGGNSTDILAAVSRGTVIIDMTTVGPVRARRFAAAARERGVFYLDAPVAGGLDAARSADLDIMVGGDPGAFSRVRSQLRLLGPEPRHIGSSGSGQQAKIAQLILIANNLVGVIETLVYAHEQDMDSELLVAIIQRKAAASWEWGTLAPRLIAGDTSSGPTIRSLLQDLETALGETERIGLDLPGLKHAQGLYRRAADLGYTQYGTQVISRVYQDET